MENFAIIVIFLSILNLDASYANSCYLAKLTGRMNRQLQMKQK